MKKTLTNLSLAVPTLVLALTTLVSVPVFAQHGTDDSTGTSSNSGSGSSDDTTVATTTDDTSGTNDTENETQNESSRESLRALAKQQVAELKHEHKAKTAEERQKACVARKQGLTNKFARITTNSTRLETRIGTFLTRAQTYQSTNNVTVTNWDTLVATANTAKTNVDTAITNMKAVTPSLDCNSGTVAQDVATFKEAAQKVRDSLKAYKTAVKDVFVALENAKGTSSTDTTDTNTTSTGGNQ